jgi:hypothetical protein
VARSLGLDCGPMSGFDNEAVDKEFLPDGQVKSNFRYGEPACSSVCHVRASARCARSSEASSEFRRCGDTMFLRRSTAAGAR